MEELSPAILGELNDLAQLDKNSVPEPILITASGTILAGFGCWRLAISRGGQAVHCIEYQIGDQEALEFILRHHKLRRTWNAFVRICMALSLETHLQQQALENMRAGGKYKGSANLPEVHRIDVREAIAKIAGVGARNVSNVRGILRNAHPRLREALRDGTLSINGAMQLLELPKTEQLEEFVQLKENHATNKLIRQCIAQPKEEKISPDVVTLLETLHRQEARQPGSVITRIGKLEHTVVLVGRDLLSKLRSVEQLRMELA